ncbi:MAG: DUF1839 family protein [Myxococcaceae bacterium]|nr:DUF1839 family protein [Myxococcaceae bacterium]
MPVQVSTLSAQGYRPHALHSPERSWPETNCYSDLWIEMLHGFGREPLAALGFTAALDFEGDQWTFFKPPPSDLLRLFGLEVLEMAVWRPLEQHLVEHVAQGRLVLVELDSFYLPDTRGTAYQAEHVKTTVGVQAIDVEGQRLGYFHNAGYWELEGQDYLGVFRRLPHFQVQPDVLPPYVEMVKTHPALEQRGPALVRTAAAILREHLARRPGQNPFTRFEARFAKDLDWLLTQPMATFHLYAFNTLRQIGANFELLGSHLQYLRANGEALDGAAATAFVELAAGAKALQFQLARAVNKKKLPDWKPTLAGMHGKYEQGMAALSAWAAR